MTDVTQCGYLVRRDNPTIKIAGTVEHFTCISTIHQGRIGPNGRVDFDTYGDATYVVDNRHNPQRTQQRIFLDEYGAEVLEADVVLLLDSGSLLFPFHPWKRHA